MTPAPQTTTLRGDGLTRAWAGRLQPPVLEPGRVGADALAGHGHLDQVRPVRARGDVEAAPEGRLQLLARLHALAVHALRASKADVVHRRVAQPQAGVLAVADHLG